MTPSRVLGALCLLTLALDAHSGQETKVLPAARCEQLPSLMSGKWPDDSARILTSQLVAASSVPIPGKSAGAIALPEHCDVTAILQERTGNSGQHYAIRFHLRLPVAWNRRFLFQGGAGSNGDIGNALGFLGEGQNPALTQGFAVVSQDSGHDTRSNYEPASGGATAFGFDPQARANYGHSSLPLVTDAAKAVIAEFYGQHERFSYFMGCSKGGAEGMALAQRYPDAFDGIVAGAPGMSLPRAAVTEAWDVQALAEISRQSGASEGFASFYKVVSDQDLQLVAQSVLKGCDADDGLTDGIVNAFEACSTSKVAPWLEKSRCRPDNAEACLTDAKITAIKRIFGGPRNRAGQALYSDWPWDTGIASPGWRLWKLGSSDGKVPALNIILGGISLASVFTTPPTPLHDDPNQLFEYLRRFDFDLDAPRIYATAGIHARSAWDDVSARSSDLRGFRKNRGRLIVTHGVSDPVFSINDTLAWYREVNASNAGRADSFVRVFAVPGMTHCGSGPSTDRFDSFSALVDWVERGRAPDKLLAHANASAPWPGRERPLCPYPKIARYKGRGDVERAESFDCAAR